MLRKKQKLGFQNELSLENQIAKKKIRKNFEFIAFINIYSNESSISWTTELH